MRKLLVLLIAVFTVFPAVGFAAVQGSMHDMDAYVGTDGNKGGACAYCHIPHGAAGQKLYKDSITASGNRWGQSDQIVSLICTTCHNATGGGYIKASRQSVAMTNDNAHRDSVAALSAWGDNSTPASGVKVSSAGRLECTSCHDPHATTTRPFLTHTALGGDLNANCVKCHVNRSNPLQSQGADRNSIAWDNGTVSGNASQHPTNLTTGENMSGTAASETEGWVTTINTAFSGAPVTGDSASGFNTTDGGNWHSGGKYNNRAGTTTAVGCNTCHAVHGVEGGAGGATGTVTFFNDTAKGAGVVVLAMANSQGDTTSGFCQGCHNAGTNGNGVVTNAGLKHPVNTASNAWRTAVSTTTGPYKNLWTWGSDGTNAYLVCNTCHDVHYGSDNTAILRKKAGNPQIDNQVAANWGSMGEFCKECHNTSPGQVPAFLTGNHHPVSYDKNGNPLPLTFQQRGASLNNNANIFGEASGNTMHATAANTIWATRTRNTPSGLYTFATTTVGGIAGTYMTCGTCHFNNATGFNPASTGAHTLNLALDTNTESEMCVDCHGFNPSQLVLKYMKATTNPLPDNAVMTHFVGSIRTNGAAPSQNQGTPGYKRTTAWNGQTLLPIYSAEGSNGEIICESCHSWKDGNTTYTNTGARGHDNSLSQNVVYGMLAPGGNAYDVATWDAYLCSGCHGQAPGGGSSHPTLPNSLAAAATAGILTNVDGQGTSGPFDVKQGKATLSSANRPNCDSCHRPHNASAGTGALILEAGLTTPTSNKAEFRLAYDNNGGTEWLNQEGLCSRCHTQGK